MGADAAQCANYTSSPTKRDQHLYPPYSNEGVLSIERRDASPSAKGSPSQRRKNISPGGKINTKGKKKGVTGSNVPDSNALSPSSPKTQSPNVRRKSRPKSAPKRSPQHTADHHHHLQNSVDDYATPDDYQLDDYSEEEIKLPDDAYDEDYEEDDEGQSTESGGSISPARRIGKGDKDGNKLSASNARRHKGGKERRKKRKEDTKVTWHD